MVDSRTAEPSPPSVRSGETIRPRETIPAAPGLQEALIWRGQVPTEAGLSHERLCSMNLRRVGVEGLLAL